MSPSKSISVAGVDGWKANWIAILLVDGAFSEAVVVRDLARFTHDFAELVIIGIDIPIGLPQSGVRACDALARTFIRPLSSSVFSAPPPDVMAQLDYTTANALSKEQHGRGISKQAYGLKPKIDAVALLGDSRFREVHPEVSFRALSEQPLEANKKSWRGQAHRRRLLEGAGIFLPDDPGDVGRAPADDILDAAIAAWTAHRIATGKAECLPADPAPGEAVIWY
ncbi:MAG: DUF429 domain-containing protein [Acidimicrobiia bacterium]|nr:DUF429 domain-containing protein [Acidimicrobiia bacterium]MBT8251187.1 DUF429 domain-containing protein [Acidimicrobiia bacterium]NNC42886.1 DUF429 domain-containing protein [Acidimicrobiia bacterium]NNL29350.1 DUF429 domain-containing protein [Acidimicrobiia bacterium]